MRFTLSAAIRVALLCLLTTGVGCRKAGPETVVVTGKVTFRGRPVTTGAVVLQSDKGDLLEPASIDPAGVYLLEAPAGTYRVAVIAMSALEQGNQEGRTPEESNNSARLLLPEHYGRPETSRLQIVVKPGGENEIPLNLM